MKLSEQVMIEAQIGFYWGIIVGALASYVFIMFFTTWQWYFKLFSTIGELGILGTLGMGLYQLIKTRRNYLDAQAEMKKMSEESAKVIQNYTG
jgi:predicted ferric reductase